jgi:hypothetical protein
LIPCNMVLLLVHFLLLLLRLLVIQVGVAVQ